MDKSVNNAGFDQATMAHIDSLYGYALTLTRDATEAEDLVQETYVRAASAANHPDADSNLKGWLFKPRPEPRLGVVEQASLDSRRRLLLIRRDDVEHLIMTGGPVDVVIENGIKAPESDTVARASAEPSPPVFARQARSFGQAVNE